VTQGPFAVLILVTFAAMIALRGRLNAAAGSLSGRLVLAALAADAMLIALDLASGGYGFFNLNNERNIPTLWSSMQLFGVALLVDGARRGAPAGDRPGRVLWICVAAMFVYLALDESLTIHEHVGKALSSRYFRDFFLRYFERTRPTPAAWVFFYLPVIVLAVVGLGVFHRRCLSVASPAGRLLFALGVGLYVGAIGMELVETKLRHAPIYRMLEVLEESFELVGTTAFLGWAVGLSKRRQETNRSDPSDAIACDRAMRGRTKSRDASSVSRHFESKGSPNPVPSASRSGVKSSRSTSKALTPFFRQNDSTSPVDVA